MSTLTLKSHSIHIVQSAGGYSYSFRKLKLATVVFEANVKLKSHTVNDRLKLDIKRATNSRTHFTLAL